MAFKFSQRSLDRMKGVHPDLIAVMELAIQRTPIDFTVLEGVRSIERQRKLVRSGASKTMNSRHLTGHAIDIAPLAGGEVSWDWPLYHKLAPVIKGAAADLGVDIEWGGDWSSFKDGPHWQLSWATYGKDDKAARATLDRPMAGQVEAPQHRSRNEPIAAPEPLHAGHSPTARESVDQTKTAWLARLQKWWNTSSLSLTGLIAAFRDLDPQVQLALLGVVVVIGAGGAWIIASLTRREREKHFLAGVK